LILTVTVVAYVVQYLPQTCSKMPTPLVNRNVNDASVCSTPNAHSGLREPYIVDDGIESEAINQAIIRSVAGLGSINRLQSEM